MITCLFTFETCGLTDSPVLVRAREKQQDVMLWFKDVCLEACAGQHMLLAPLCNGKVFKNVKIPLGDKEGARIGMQTDKIPPKGTNK